MEINKQPDAHNRSPSERVVQAVASASNTDPLELPPLYRTVDTDALDTLVDEQNSGVVHFRYAGHVVTIDSDGTIDVADTPSYDSKRAESEIDD